jgi:hypothetical protein
MSGQSSSIGPADPKTINVHEESEVDWWMRKLGVSYEQLRQAVSKVGPDAAKVAKYLNRALPRDL